jgi:hypothetical protein
MFDLQHIPDKRYCKILIKDYSVGKGVCIALPPNEHFRIKRSKLQLPFSTSARSLLYLEMRRLRTYTSVPVEMQIKIIEMNKKLFPTSFKRLRK